MIDMKSCEGKWHDLLELMGIDRRHLTGRHGPCPICGGRDRFRFDNHKNRGGWICNQCGSGDGASLLMKVNGWDFKTLAAELEPIVGRARVKLATARRSSDSQRRSMERLWAQAQPVRHDDVVSLYLENRGLALPRFPEVIRFNPNARHNHAKSDHPAMVVRIDSPKGELSQLHTTFLTETGQKADVDPVRMTHWGTFAEGSAVQIGPAAPKMGIAEGVETALSAALAHKIPVWAAVSSQLLLKWNPPEVAEHVLVFGDNDGNFTGQSAAYALANRLAVQNTELKVEVRIPDRPGTDWNDNYAALQKQEAI